MLQCCTTLNKWKDPIGNVCIYDIMGPTPRRYRGDDEEEWGDDDTGVPLMGVTSVTSCFPAHQVACVVVSLTRGTVANSAADWAGRPVQEHAGQHLEEVVAKRRAAQAAATQQPFGLSRCSDPLIPSPEPHELWLNRP